MPSATSASDNSSRLSKHDTADLFAINGMLDSLRNNLPEEPYILTIPQNVSDRYGHPNSYQASQWLYQSPFKRGEDWEGLQYQTWEYHDPMNPMFVQRTHMEVEASQPGSSQRRERERPSTPLTGASTPSGTAKPKNVLSFAAYKNKKEGTPLPEDAAAKKLEDAKRRDAVKGPVERVRAETEEVLAAARDVQDQDDHAYRENKKEETETIPHREMKRKRAPAEEQVSKDDGQHAANTPVAKKPRKNASPPTPVEPRQRNEKSHRPSDDRHSPGRSPSTSKDATDGPMPPKLSPLQSVPELPERLSPTVPDNIMAAIQRKNKGISSEDVSASSSASKTKKDITPTKRVDDVRKHVSPVPRNGFRAGSQTGSPAPSSKAPAVQPPDTSRDHDANRDPRPAESRKKQSLIVKLKIKKSLQENVRRLLRFPARPKKVPREDDRARTADELKHETSTERRNSERRQAGAKGVAQKIGPTTTTTAKSKREDGQDLQSKTNDRQETESSVKRRKPTDENSEDTPVPKKRKVPDPTEVKKAPVTPVPVQHSSPPASITRSDQVTSNVRKDIFGTGVQQRARSSESVQNTPSGHSNTPTSGSNIGGATSKAASSQPSEKTPLQQAWEKEQARLQILGRDLKHTAQKRMSASQSAASPGRDKMLAAAICLECMLTFMLTFVSADQACEAADPRMPPNYGNWKTLYSFVDFVRSYCKSVPLLDGVVSLMSVAALSRLLNVSGRISEEKGPKREELLNFQGRLLSSAADAEARLALSRLQEAFPKTWEGRTKDSQPLEADKIRPREFAGPYILPIGVQTSPLRAVRAGYSMLQEWIDKEGLGYEMKLKL